MNRFSTELRQPRGSDGGNTHPVFKNQRCPARPLLLGATMPHKRGARAAPNWKWGIKKKHVRHDDKQQLPPTQHVHVLQGSHQCCGALGSFTIYGLSHMGFYALTSRGQSCQLFIATSDHNNCAYKSHSSDDRPYPTNQQLAPYGEQVQIATNWQLDLRRTWPFRQPQSTGSAVCGWPSLVGH